MGAANAMAIRQLYGRHLPSSTMHLLTHMALVSLDDDHDPWYSQGHLTLAEHGLFRPVTCRCGQCRACRAHIEAVRRALKPARELGAIEVDRAPARHRVDGPRTTRYRLILRRVAPLPIPPESEAPTSSENEESGSQRYRETVANAPDKPCQRSRQTVPTLQAERVPEEKEEKEERMDEDVVTSQGDLTTRAYPDEQANEIDHGEVGEDGPDAARRDAAPAAIHDEDDGESAKPQVTPVVRSTASPAEESPHSQGTPQEQGIGRRVSRPAGVPDHVARLLPPHLRPTRLRAS